MSAVCVFLFLIFAFTAIVYLSIRIGSVVSPPVSNEETRSFRPPSPEDFRRAEQEEACLDVLREEEARAATRAVQEEIDDVVLGAIVEEALEEEEDPSDDDESPW